MGRIIVQFLISKKLRKERFAEDKNSDAVQYYSMGNSDPLFDEVLELASFTSTIPTSVLCLDCSRYLSGTSPIPPTEWDHIPTTQELIEDHKRRIRERDLQLSEYDKKEKENEVESIFKKFSSFLPW